MGRCDPERSEWVDGLGAPPDRLTCQGPTAGRAPVSLGFQGELAVERWGPEKRSGGWSKLSSAIAAYYLRVWGMMQRADMSCRL